MTLDVGAADCDRWTGFVRESETVGELGPSRFSGDARAYSGNLGTLQVPRAGKRRGRGIISGNPMVLGDGSAAKVDSV